jgi:LCP family protein required for cell wall assembly
VDTASPTLAPATATLEPSPSPTARPGIDPTLDASAPDPNASLEMPVPEPMPQLHLDRSIVNILLLGRDTERASGAYRTDVMIVVSINKAANSVTMLTIPRDLFVYIPGWTMNRINTAAGHGDAIGYPGGGVALLEQTILYNLGIPIHGWARVDFDGFKNVVDIVGGVDVPVSCAMQDWRLIDPSKDDHVRPSAAPEHAGQGARVVHPVHQRRRY